MSSGQHTHSICKFYCFPLCFISFFFYRFFLSHEVICSVLLFLCFFSGRAWRPSWRLMLFGDLPWGHWHLRTSPTCKSNKVRAVEALVWINRTKPQCSNPWGTPLHPAISGIDWIGCWSFDVWRRLTYSTLSSSLRPLSTSGHSKILLEKSSPQSEESVQTDV